MHLNFYFTYNSSALVESTFGATWEDPEGGFIKFVVKRASKQDQTLHMEGKLHVILYFREECKQIGDSILQVNEINLVGLAFDEALQILKDVVENQKVQTVRLVVGKFVSFSDYPCYGHLSQINL